MLEVRNVLKVNRELQCNNTFIKGNFNYKPTLVYDADSTHTPYVYQVKDYEAFLDISQSAFQASRILLPLIKNNEGRIIHIFDSQGNANNYNIDIFYLSEYLDGGSLTTSTYAVADITDAYGFVSLICDGINWISFGSIEGTTWA